MSLWSAFALCAALVWERTPPPLRLAGLCFLLLAGAAAAVIAFFAPEVIRSVVPTATPFANSMVLRSLLEIAALALSLFALAALFLARRPRSEIALLLVLASMVPIGLCLAEGASRIAPAFSLAGAARSLNPLLEERGEVLFEGPLRNASSLTFYLPRKFYLVNQEPDFFDQSAEAQQKYLDENFVLEAWNRADPIYLIIDEHRLPHWQELVTARVHIYHQVTTCGRYVVLSNQL